MLVNIRSKGLWKNSLGPDGRHEYGHDVRDWLTSRATGPEGAAVADESYAYDDVGNRTGGHLAGGQDYGAERLNRLLLDDGFTYTYDGDGNLLGKVGRGDGATTTYTWDALGRLGSVILPGGAVVRYRYDVLGRRVERAVGAAAESYAYDGHDVVGVYDDGNVLKESYLYGPGIDNVLAAIRHTQSGTEVVYYHKDGLNSVTAVTDAEHNVLRRYAYDSFGNLLSVKDGTGNALATQPQDRFTYTGREYDSDVDLYFYRARYYDAKAGRFISEDPVWDVNLYPYVGNMPMDAVDPMGNRYVAFCYTGTGAKNFDKSCKTWEKEIKSKNKNADVKRYYFKYDNDFKIQWEELAKKNIPIDDLRIYGHSEPGRLLVRPNPRTDDIDITAQEIAGLSKLNWKPRSTASFYSCRSGLEGDNGDTLIKSMSKNQCVKSCGQEGYSYFSTSPTNYSPVSNQNSVYLDDFDRCQNAGYFSAAGVDCGWGKISGQSHLTGVGTNPQANICESKPVSCP